MKKIIISITSILFVILFAFAVIKFDKNPKETTFELNKMDDRFALRIHNDLDTKYFNQKITVNTNLFVKDNSIFVEKDTYNNSDKISNIMFIESYDKSVRLVESTCATIIEDDSKLIKVYTTFTLQYPSLFYRKREFFKTKDTFEYKLNDNGVELNLIESKEWAE